MDELVETLRTVSQPLANARRDMAENINTRINELTDSLRTLSDPLSTGSKEMAANVSNRINELSEILNGVVLDSRRKGI